MVRSKVRAKWLEVREGGLGLEMVAQGGGWWLRVGEVRGGVARVGSADSVALVVMAGWIARGMSRPATGKEEGNHVMRALVARLMGWCLNHDGADQQMKYQGGR